MARQRCESCLQDLNFGGRRKLVLWLEHYSRCKLTARPRPSFCSLQRSPIEMFREQLSLQRRSKKRSPVEDSNYERSSSPLLGFHSPALRGRRGMMHAKSCDMTPLRLKLHMQESCSSDDSWNVAANDNSSCQVCYLTH